jgi:hypothetical protein
MSARAVFPRKNEAFSLQGKCFIKENLISSRLTASGNASRAKESERERTIMSTMICSRRAMERALLLKRKSSRFTSTFASNSSFSSKAQQREDEDEAQRGHRLGGTITTTSALPSLRSRMKHFAKIVHPDILGQHFPRANAMHESEDKERKYVLENNQNALAELNAVLDSITKEKKFPKTGVKVIIAVLLLKAFFLSLVVVSFSLALCLCRLGWMFVPLYASGCSRSRSVCLSVLSLSDAFLSLSLS